MATDVLEHTGTTSMSAEALATQLWYLGAAVSISCSDQSLVVSLSGPDRNMEPSVALLDQWFRDASVDAALLKETSGRIIGERKDLLDDPSSTQWLLRAYAEYGSESPLLHEPSNDALRKATPAQIKGILSQVPDFQHQTLYFGPRTAQAAGAALSWGKNHRPLAAPQPLQRRSVTVPTVYFVGRDTAKSNVWISFAQPPQTEAQRGDAGLIGTYLGGGMAGLIFQEIREARGLAYSAWASIDSGDLPTEPWALIASVSTQSDKTLDAIDAMLEVLRRPLDASRLARSKQEHAESYRTSRVDPREVPSMVHQWARLGLPEDPRPARRQRAADVRLDDLQAFYAAFTRQPPIIAIVGNPRRVSLTSLAKLEGLENAKVETVPLSKLTSWGR